MMKSALTRVLAIVAAVLWAGADAYSAHSDHGCHNCHAPHKAASPDDPNASWGVPTWSTAQTADGLPVFTLYSSSTFDGLSTDIGQPDGASKLCLGCHDGSYFVFGFIPDSRAIFGTDDLAESHPISFTYNTTLAAKVRNGSLHDPSVATLGLGGTIREDLLDEMDKMQCISCHDVHESGIGEYQLRYEYDTEAHTDNLMCQVCHNR